MKLEVGLTNTLDHQRKKRHLWGTNGFLINKLYIAAYDKKTPIGLIGVVFVILWLDQFKIFHKF